MQDPITESKIELNPNPLKVQNYLKLIAEAIRVESQNGGSLRKHIWAYLMAHY